MSKVRASFVCQQCGYSQSQWGGKCPECDTWNSLVETTDSRVEDKGKRNIEVRLLGYSDAKHESAKRLSTGDVELDGVLGGGLVLGETVLVAGEPGIGKSTLLTQVALDVDLPVLYVCGEESSSQVSLRIRRLKNEKRSGKSLTFLESVDLDSVCRAIVNTKPGLVVVDSIQTLTAEELTGGAGSVGQVRESAIRISEVCKALGIPVFLVGHVTKDGNIAGPRVLEHLVDCVLWFEGERSQSLRLIRSIKNRFGTTEEIGVWEMQEKGLVVIRNPSEMFLSERVKNVSGSVVSVVMEGSRPLLVEIQALTVASTSPVPRRVATGIDFSRLQMLIAVLVRRANIHIEGVDVYVNVTGGIKLADRGVDLAICVAIASSFLNKNLPPDVAAVGEIGLLGEVRRVSALDKRVKEAKKMGYRVASAESGRTLEAAIKKLLS